MKRILLILILFLSCDEVVGPESSSSYSYYDYVSQGWHNLFQEDYLGAINNFNQSLEVDIPYCNSAIVGMGWTNTYQANSLIYSDECYNQTIDNDCVDTLDDYRNNAKCFFLKSIIELGKDTSCEMTSEQILNECVNIDINTEFNQIDFMSGGLETDLDEIATYYEEDCNEDNNANVDYVNCYEDFFSDIQVGYLYLKYLEYKQGIITNQECIDSNQNLICDNLENLIELFENFVNSMPQYDIMGDDKLVFYEPKFSFNYKHVESTLAHLYLDANQIELSCEHAAIVCPALSCPASDETYIYLDLAHKILECIESSIEIIDNDI